MNAKDIPWTGLIWKAQYALIKYLGVGVPTLVVNFGENIILISMDAFMELSICKASW